MDAKTLDRYRGKLRDIAGQIQRSAQSIEEEARGASEGDNAGELSHAPLHLGDRATDEMLVDLNATYLENEAKLLQDALAALQRIDAGTFGICESCGQEIARARLDAIPSVRLCIDCAKQERDVRPNVDVGRPHGPEDTMQPEGFMNERGDRAGSLFAEMSGRSERGDEQTDRYATGTAGGGTAFGGLGGTNEGRGEPDVAELSNAHANGESDVDEAYEEGDDDPRSGRSGGAVGGTPANKRSRSRE
ncbi:MAG TPA: TraR/DksA C4-type zinc finger protein [Pirellulaceae bacterium]|jgi:RNA polymerase-binding protein DksA|nr:TraR/DksA C4-type zinc finger protein [Pirellulaceae bacterium]